MSTVPAAVQAVLEHDPVNPVNPDAAPAVTTDDDVDFIFLREAQQAVEQEKAPAADPDPVKPAEPVSPAPAAAEQPEPAEPAIKDQGDKPIMIPKGRLDQALQDAAYWRGQAEARGAAGQAGASVAETTPAAPAKTADQLLSEIEAKKVDLAGRFDDGALTAKQWKEQEALLDREIRTLLAQPPQPATPPTASEDLYLDELTAKLEDDHPYTKEIPAADKAAWDFIENRAIANLQQRGVTLAPRADGTLDSRSAYELRREMAVLTDTLGPVLTGKTIAPTTQPNGAPNPKPPVAPAGPSATAQARAAKLDLAANHPPDVNALGRPGGGAGEITDTDINRMSDDEIAALPATVRARFLKT